MDKIIIVISRCSASKLCPPRVGAFPVPDMGKAGTQRRHGDIPELYCLRYRARKFRVRQATRDGMHKFGRFLRTRKQTNIPFSFAPFRKSNQNKGKLMIPARLMMMAMNPPPLAPSKVSCLRREFHAGDEDLYCNRAHGDSPPVMIRNVVLVESERFILIDLSLSAFAACGLCDDPG